MSTQKPNPPNNETETYPGPGFGKIKRYLSDRWWSLFGNVSHTLCIFCHLLAHSVNFLRVGWGPGHLHVDARIRSRYHKPWFEFHLDEYL